MVVKNHSKIPPYNSFKICDGAYNLKKKSGNFANLVREILEKSGSLMIENHWSPSQNVFLAPSFCCYHVFTVKILRKGSLFGNSSIKIGWNGLELVFFTLVVILYINIIFVVKTHCALRVITNLPVASC